MFKESQFFIQREIPEKPEKTTEAEPEVRSDDVDKIWNMSKEEAKSYFDDASMEHKEKSLEYSLKEDLENKLAEWVKNPELILQLQQRAKHFGLPKSAVEDVQNSLMESFRKDTDTITNECFLEKFKKTSLHKIIPERLKEIEKKRGGGF